MSAKAKSAKEHKSGGGATAMTEALEQANSKPVSAHKNRAIHQRKKTYLTTTD
jgi:hypothetical protein